jgi:hypothetical protein
LTTLKHAFDANSINGLAQKIIKGAYPPIAPTYSKSLRELIKSMLFVAPSSRPSIKQILQMPFVKKSIKKFVFTVLANKHFYGVNDVNNFKQQIIKLGLQELINEAFQEIQSMQNNQSNNLNSNNKDSNNLPAAEFSKQKKAAEEAEARKAAIELERKQYLQQLEQEELAKKNLEAALERIQKEHAAKAKKLANLNNNPAINSNKVNIMQSNIQSSHAEEQRRRSAALLVAKKSAIVEAERKKQLEQREKERREYEAQKRAKELAEANALEKRKQAEAELAEDRRRAAAAARKRREQVELLREAEEEKKKRELAYKREMEAKLEAEKMEIERIRLEREWYSSTNSLASFTPCSILSQY